MRGFKNRNKRKISYPVPTLFNVLKITLLAFRRALRDLFPMAKDLGEEVSYTVLESKYPNDIREAHYLIKKIDSLLDDLRNFQWAYCEAPPQDELPGSQTSIF
jgi:hypothetical protein